MSNATTNFPRRYAELCAAAEDMERSVVDRHYAARLARSLLNAMFFSAVIEGEPLDVIGETVH